MNLVIDEGNTTIKVALFDDNSEPLEVYTQKSVDIDEVDALISMHSIDSCIYSSVAGYNKTLASIISDKVNHFMILSHDTRLPIKIDYLQPDTLGVDRIAGAVGAWYYNQGANNFIIDAGTAITYDFISADGEFKGGNISPGITMRFKALNHYTKCLPLISKSEDYPMIGYDTATAILSGVMSGIISEALGYINLLCDKYQGLTIIITGGDHSILYNKLKNATFVQLKDEKHLVLKGLNRILNYNVNN
ncbi:MAG: type III pantothenate kinase [Bacteroidales bacterium]